MPIYEWRCRPCELTFEGLATAVEASRPRACPDCGRRARRIMSAAAFAVKGESGGARRGAGDASGADDVTKLRPPPWARMCWMDDRSAARFAAHKLGRGAEYDDKTAAREERRQREGLAPEKPAANPHTHTHHDAKGAAKSGKRPRERRIGD